MVEVFKTNVEKAAEANSIIALLQRYFPHSKINFDLDDCDKILRVEGEEGNMEKVPLLVAEKGFECEVLE